MASAVMINGYKFRLHARRCPCTGRAPPSGTADLQVQGQLTRLHSYSAERGSPPSARKTERPGAATRAMLIYVRSQ
jgi:hypothetical protein